MTNKQKEDFKKDLQKLQDNIRSEVEKMQEIYGLEAHFDTSESSQTMIITHECSFKIFLYKGKLNSITGK
jgi:hypothetical protein